MSATTCAGGCAASCSPVSLAFELPADRVATSPAEERGTGRDDVALMVGRVHDGGLADLRFPVFPDLLSAGDLVVVNTSATLPAALTASVEGGIVLRLHLSTRLAGSTWAVELREPSGAGSVPWSSVHRVDELHGMRLALPGGATAELLAPYPAKANPDDGETSRLWVAAIEVPTTIDAYLHENGAPICYSAAGRAWPISAYQTVYATEPGSAEMPSAGRAFTPEILARLVSNGVGVVPIVLHAGVSSPDDHEPPYPEWYSVPAQTAASVNAARAGGGRVVAVGTTVVRALESSTGDDGVVRESEGWTDLVIGPDRPPRAVDGLLTGWHEPGASHLHLLESVAGMPLLRAAYARALAGDYLWHEFGDLFLILP
jgi:S-adenosylmethionine:tRNA ribosyltransferase-isomerase